MRQILPNLLVQGDKELIQEQLLIKEKTNTMYYRYSMESIFLNV